MTPYAGSAITTGECIDVTSHTGSASTIVSVASATASAASAAPSAATNASTAGAAASISTPSAPTASASATSGVAFVWCAPKPPPPHVMCEKEHALSWRTRGQQL